MSTTVLAPRLFLRASSASIRCSISRRCVSTLPNNPHIYVHSDPTNSSSHLLSLLPTPPTSTTRSLTLGSTPTIPPTPSSLTTNPDFLHLVHSVIAEHAIHDPIVKAAAAAFATNAQASGLGGFAFGGGGGAGGQGGLGTMGASQQRQRSRGSGGIKEKLKKQAERIKAETESATESSNSSIIAATAGSADEDGAGGANHQGGMGGGGRGGWIHVSDQRNPPDWGRIAYPEDIFGSVEVDGNGEFVGGNGGYQVAGTYRLITTEGILGLPPYLRGKLVKKLKELEANLSKQ